VSLPHTHHALPAYYILAPAEASSNLARYDGVRYGLRIPGDDLISTYENTRAAGFGREVKRRIMIGTYVLSAGYYDAYYLRAQKIRTLIKRDFDEAWDKVDVMLTPATPNPAFALAEMMSDPVQMYLNDIFTVTVNMAGLPGIAVPAGLDAQGLPLALQLIGRPFDEETLFRAAEAVETAANFTAQAGAVVGVGFAERKASDHLYSCGVYARGCELSVAGEQRRLEPLGQRHVSCIVGRHGMAQLPNSLQ
jgi:aspartyl-tRNA(Asn)/glutamyl-tRNA(Gln) amidotransferase subunit A